MLIVPIPAWVAATNAYLVAPEPGSPAIVIDAPPDPALIGKVAAEHDLAIVAIVLTHGHIDHTGGAGELEKTTGAAVYVHPDDDFLTLHPIRQLQMMFGITPPGSYEIPSRFERLSHGQNLHLAGVGLEVRHTPGHTPGHCIFYSETEGVLFSGDQLFAGSIGRTDLPGGSIDQLVVSMREQVMTLDDDVQVLPGHGPVTTIGEERHNNVFRDLWE